MEEDTVEKTKMGWAQTNVVVGVGWVWMQKQRSKREKTPWISEYTSALATPQISNIFLINIARYTSPLGDITQDRRFMSDISTWIYITW